MKFKFLFFIICLVALFAFQAKVVMPIVYDIVASDFFLEDSGDEVNRTSSSTLMTNAAFNQCNTYVANDVLSDHTITFPKSPLNAFSLGNYKYVINADIEVTPESPPSVTRRYVCRIKFHNDDENTDASDSENWDILFTEVGREVNGFFLINAIAWAAVAFGGSGAWKKHREAGLIAEAPK